MCVLLFCVRFRPQGITIYHWEACRWYLLVIALYSRPLHGARVSYISSLSAFINIDKNVATATQGESGCIIIKQNYFYLVHRKLLLEINYPRVSAAAALFLLQPPRLPLLVYCRHLSYKCGINSPSSSLRGASLRLAVRDSVIYFLHTATMTREPRFPFCGMHRILHQRSGNLLFWRAGWFSHLLLSWREGALMFSLHGAPHNEQAHVFGAKRRVVVFLKETKNIKRHRGTHLFSWQLNVSRFYCTYT
jgi:hypothetical protein